MLKIVVAAVAAGLLWLVPSAQAEEEEVSRGERERALELVRQGGTAYEAGQYGEAVGFLREARTLLPSETRVSLNLAMALEAVGTCSSLREAQTLYSELGVGTGTVPVNARQGNERVAPLIEERCQEESPEELPSEPPPEEEPPVEESEEEEGGGDAAPTEDASSAEETPSPRRSGGEVAGYALLGAGLTLVAVGSGLWGGSVAAADDRDTQCGRQCESQEALGSWILYDDRRASFALAGDIVFFLGLAIAVVGAIWAPVAYRHRLRLLQRDGELPPAAVSLRPRGGGLVLAF